MAGSNQLITAMIERKITLEPEYRSSIATFNVDCQNGFTYNCPGELPVKGGIEIVDELNKQYKLAGVHVASKDAHCLSAVYNATQNEPQFTKLVGYPNADIKWNTHCVMGTYGAELISGLPGVTEYDYFVWKGIEPTIHPYGACYHDSNNKLSTGVIEFLDNSNVDTVIVGGIALDYCVKLTALQLAAANFSVIVNLGACCGIAPDTIAQAIKEFRGNGIFVVDSTEDIKIAIDSFGN
jgi:nicotinamidase/pyrazinamidase